VVRAPDLGFRDLGSNPGENTTTYYYF
jgi:hypothetical protein